MPIIVYMLNGFVFHKARALKKYLDTFPKRPLVTITYYLCGQFKFLCIDKATGILSANYDKIEAPYSDLLILLQFCR